MEREEIRRIANIAMLEFTDEELIQFAGSFSETVDLIDTIKQVDTDDIEGTFHVYETESHLREDIVGESLAQEDATKNTVSEKYGYFEIMKFVE